MRMRLSWTFLVLMLANAVAAEKSSRTSSSTLPPVLIRYRIPDHGSKSARLAHHTEFWGFDVPDKPLTFRQVDPHNLTDSDVEKTLLEDDDVTLKGLGKQIDSTTKSTVISTGDQNREQDPNENEAEPDFKIFPYLLIGKTDTGDHFPFLAMVRDKQKLKDVEDEFVPAFVAVAPEPPRIKEAQPTQQLIAAPILNLPMPLSHLVRHANPLIPHHDDRRPRPEASFFRQQFVEPPPFRRPEMPVLFP